MKQKEQEVQVEEPLEPGNQPKRRRKLPAPSFSKLNPNLGSVSIRDDDPSSHQGRKRTKPHVDGDWPTHVYIAIQLPSKLESVLKDIISNLNLQDRSSTWHSSLDATHEEDRSLHLSLSRPIFLKTNERNEFVERLRRSIRGIESFEIYFASFSYLLNDHRTRGFLALEVGSGYSSLKIVLDHIDRVLETFCLPKYYEQPRFHLSIGWHSIDRRSSPDLSSSDFQAANRAVDPIVQTLNDGPELDRIRKIPWKIGDLDLMIGKTLHRFRLDEPS